VEAAETKQPLPEVEGLAVAAMEPEADQGLAAPQIQVAVAVEQEETLVAMAGMAAQA
jgi:hypothetical protein